MSDRTETQRAGRETCAACVECGYLGSDGIAHERVHSEWRYAPQSNQDEGGMPMWRGEEAPRTAAITNAPTRAYANCNGRPCGNMPHIESLEQQRVTTPAAPPRIDDDDDMPPLDFVPPDSTRTFRLTEITAASPQRGAAHKALDAYFDAPDNERAGKWLQFEVAAAVAKEPQ